MKKAIITIILLQTLVSSCMKDDLLWETDNPERSPSSGVFIVNEGNFTYGNASLSFYDLETNETRHDVFFNTNGIPLGDVAQSMAIKDSLGYVVINNSGKIYTLNVETFKYTGKITGFTSPRYIHFIDDNKAYVSDIYAKSISVVDMKQQSIVTAIDVNNHDADYYQHPTEQMVQYDKFVFTNCWSFDNKVLVIDSRTDELIDSITVLKQPVAMVLDRLNKLWVLCDGGIEGSLFGRETPGLVKINAVTREVERTILFGEDDYPKDLDINGAGDTIYYINRHVYRLAALSNEDPELLIESSNPDATATGYYSLGIDPYSSEIFIADPHDHIQKRNGIQVKT